MIAPTAYQKLAHPDGELATVRAAAAAGVVACVATLATTSLEDAAAATAAPKWFQLYVHRDLGLTREIVARAEAAGYRALAVTADTPVLGRRLGDERHGFSLPAGLTMPNLRSSQLPATDASALAKYFARAAQPVVHLARPRHAARLDEAADRAQGRVARRRRRARRRARLRGGRSCRTTAGGSSTACRRRSTRCPRSSTPSPGAPRCSSTAACAGAPTSQGAGARRARGAASGGRSCGGSPSAARPACARCSRSCAASSSRAMALAGCRTLGEIDRDLVRPRQTMLR